MRVCIDSYIAEGTFASSFSKEGDSFTEMFVRIYKTTRRQIPEDPNLHKLRILKEALLDYLTAHPR